MHTFLNRSFLTKLVLALTLLTLSSLTVAVQAMTSVQSDEEIVTKFVDEARKFGLAFKPEDVEVTHTAEGTTATAILNAPWTEDAAKKGVDVGFAYIASYGTEIVPNGYYKLHMKDDATAMTLAFLDGDSKPVTVLKGTQPITTLGSGSVGGIFIDLGAAGVIFKGPDDPMGNMKPVLRISLKLQYPTATPHTPRLGE